MDLLAIHTSLGELEQRFALLREGTEARLDTLHAECCALAKKNAEAEQRLLLLRQELQAKVSELNHELQVKDDELKNVIGDRDFILKEKNDAQQASEVLCSQLKQAVESLSREKLHAQELALLELSQVQNDLEQYFMQSRRQAEMLSSSNAIIKRAFALIFKLLD